MRIRFRRHVRFDRLERVAAEEAGPAERKRVLRHLASCPSCRVRYQWVQTLPARVQDATRPPLPEESEERILDRRAAGERVILPVRDHPARRRSSPLWQGLGIAAVAMLAIGFVAWLGSRSTVQADQASGTLVTRPDAPRAGERIAVRYRPGSDLRGEPRLVLRGVLAAPLDYERPPPSARRLAELTRQGDAYEGSFSLDPNHVYAALVVESADGSVLDDGAHGGGWQLLVREGDRPTREALRANILLAGPWEMAYQAVRQATDLYPDDPRLQASRLSFERSFFTNAERDSALSAHRAHFDELVGRITARDSVSPERLAGLVEYARTVGDSSRAARLIERLADEHPLHPETMWYRVPPPPTSGDTLELHAYLRQLESLWRGAGPHPALSSPGLWTARRLGRPADIIRWADRKLAHPGWAENRSRTLLALADTPGLREEALDRLRAEIERLHSGGAGRPLHSTVDEHRRETRSEMRPLLAELGELLLAGGEEAAGLDTLRLAAAMGWDSELAARLAAAELTAGDTAAAAASLARAAAAPFEGALESGLDLSIGPRLVPAEEWEVLRRAARDRLRRENLDRSIDRSLPPVDVFDAEGRRYSLDELRRGTVAVVAFWEPRNGRAQQALPEIRRVAYLVRAMGGEFVVITRTPPNERLETLLDEKELRLPLYHDLDRRATEAFESAWTPEYHVLGFDGRLRFEDSSLDEVLTQVDALLEEPRLNAAGPRSTASLDPPSGNLLARR